MLSVLLAEEQTERLLFTGRSLVQFPTKPGVNVDIKRGEHFRFLLTYISCLTSSQSRYDVFPLIEEQLWLSPETISVFQ